MARGKFARRRFAQIAREFAAGRTFRQLRVLAGELGIPGRGALRKYELAKACLVAQGHEPR